MDYRILSDASYDDLRHQEVFWGDIQDITQIDITPEDTDHILISKLNAEEEREWYYQPEESKGTPADERTETEAPEA